MHNLSVNFKKNFMYFIYLKDRVQKEKGTHTHTEGWRDIFRLVAHSPEGYNSQDWARLMLRACTSLRVSHMGGKGPSTWTTFCWLPMYFRRALEWKQKSCNLNWCSNMGCQHCRQLPHVLQHNASPCLHPHMVRGQKSALGLIHKHRNCIHVLITI